MNKLVLIILLISTNIVVGQVNTVYLRELLYKNSTLTRVTDSNVKFKNVVFLFNQDMDPNNTGSVNLRMVEKKLDELYPRNSNSLLIIDLENKNYNTLRDAYKGLKVNKATLEGAKQNYIELIQFIRKKRPNSKIGVYGFPFKLLDPTGLPDDKNTFFNSIFEKVDVITPSIYLPYLPDEKHFVANVRFVETNLKIALLYADRFDKPVVPHFWYFVHSDATNREFQMIPKNYLKRIIKYVGRVESNKGSKISDLIWWDEAKTFYKKNLPKVKQSYMLESERHKKIVRDDLLLYYLNPKNTSVFN